MEATPTTKNLPSRNKKYFSTLTEALDYAAQGQTGYNFYSGGGKLYAVLPYAKLQKKARMLARRLINLGATRGSRVALVADTHPDFVRFFFACQYAGLTPVPLPAQIQLGGRKAYNTQLERLLLTCQPELAMATDDFMPFLSEAVASLNVRFMGTPQDYDKLPESNIPLHPMSPTELAYLQYTSGSTRFPRGVMITQKAVLSNLLSIIKYGVNLRSDDRAVSWLPYFHDMGLVGLLLAPMAGQISVDYLSSRDFAMRPRLWLKLMSENRGTISFSPPLGYELTAWRLRADEVHNYDLRAWRVAGIGAEMIRTDSLEHFADLLKPSGFDKRAFLPCYGMAECSLAISFGPLGKGLQTDHVDTDTLSKHEKAVPVNPDTGKEKSNTFVNCGVPLPGYELEVRDSTGQALPERRCGILHVRGPSVMSGYFGDLKTTQKAISPGGWLNTGDLAYQIGDSVVITGREKDLIIINGRNIWPQDIEYLAELQPEIRIRDASAFSLTNSNGKELAVLMVQCRESDKQKLSDLKKRLHGLIFEELGIDCIIEFLPRNTLSHTTSGKPSRYRARKEYLKRIAAKQSEIRTAQPHTK